MDSLKSLRRIIGNLSAMVVMSSGLLYAGTVPDIRGTWTEGLTYRSSTRCLNLVDNGSYTDPGGGTFTITNQARGSFSFTRVNTEVDEENTIESREVNSGIVTSDGTLSGTGFYSVTTNGVFWYSGTLTFTGSVLGNTLTVKKNYQDLVGNTCQRIATGIDTRSGIVPLPIVMPSHDVNDDGKADLVWRNTTSGLVAIWLMDGTTIKSSGFLGSVPLEWKIEQVGDVNGDGKADLIWRNSSSGVMAVWLMNGITITSVGFPGAGTTSTGWVIAEVGDVDGDGKEDVVWRHKNTGLVAVWLMNGTSIGSSGFLGGVPADWEIEQMGDVDGDGKADMIWRNKTSETVAIWLMNGLTISSVGFPGKAPTDWEMSGAGDMDGNGKIDLVWRNTASGVVAIWLMNGTAIGSAGFSGIVSALWEIGEVGDVNGDGKADVIWRNKTSGTMAIWLMNGLTISSVGFPGSTPTDWEIQD